ncbi:MAG: SDR family oxidoreductase [Myxococcota bacterium]
MGHRHALVTGYPGMIARRLVKKLLGTDDQLFITALIEASEAERAEAELLRIGAGDRLRVMTGDVTAMDLGLSGGEYRKLLDQTTEVYHLAALQRLGVDRALADRVNVRGTQNVLDFAGSLRHLERMVHFSSAFVSGSRVGVIREEELEHGSGFRNPYEATKYQAELRVREAQKRLPITIVRPSAVVGDSRTGEIDRMEGVYQFLILIAASPAAFPIPLPGAGSAPLHLVPVDFVVDAVHAIASMAETIGKTYHIVDPSPWSARGVYELVAERSGRRAPRYSVSPNLTKALLRIPGLERFAPLSHQVVDYLNQLAFYAPANTLDALEGTGIRCPRLESYIDNLIAYVRTAGLAG